MKRIICLSALCLYLPIGSILLGHPGPALAKSIGKDQVNIRSGPSLKSEIAFHAPLGYPIKIEREKGKWAFFRDWEDKGGWVYKPLISNIETVVVLVDKANIRESASKRSKVVAMAKKGEIYKVLDRSSRWIRLGYYFENEAVGWVRSDLVFGD